MGFILSVIVGALIGWIASLVMRGSARQRLHDIVVGCGGSIGCLALLTLFRRKRTEPDRPEA